MQNSQLLTEVESKSNERNAEIVVERRLDHATFRGACSRFTTGIAIVTLIGTDGSPYGLTVNSFTSVSLDPPLILVCLDNRSHVLKHFEVGCKFGVNVLSEQQRELSQMFTRYSADRFSRAEWLPGKSGVPLFAGTIATFECALTHATPGGDHMILIGGVEEVSYSEGNGLAYFSSNYRVLGAHT